MPDLAPPLAEGHTESMQARPGAAGLTHDAAQDEPDLPGWLRREIAPASGVMPSGRRCGRWACCSSR